MNSFVAVACGPDSGGNHFVGGSPGVDEGVAGAGGEWGVVHGSDDVVVELGDDTGSGFAGGGVVEYGTADGEFAGRAGAGRAAGAECVGWRWADSGFGDYVDYAVEDAGAGDDAGDLVSMEPWSRNTLRDILRPL